MKSKDCANCKHCKIMSAWTHYAWCTFKNEEINIYDQNTCEEFEENKSESV